MITSFLLLVMNTELPEMNTELSIAYTEPLFLMVLANNNVSENIDIINISDMDSGTVEPFIEVKLPKKEQRKHQRHHERVEDDVEESGVEFCSSRYY